MTQTLKIVYDGDCPFCARYVRFIRLKDTVGDVDLIDARSDDPAVEQVRATGVNLNDGMALIDGDRIYFGDECIHRLALMSTPSGLFNRLNAAVFRSPALSRLLYPVLKTGRAITLRLMGRTPI
ncbi:thiol-disulfide oxidoreductase DCC family protein [Neptunicoccus cionae]|uniref:thiol-disulfide oxidoreductase DCC family protein n=1 Tax=Neptunicoccus cionae TaxID=2035344 RepID=UPI000C793504|nr:DUF393 domain-containing protein [Amylibacter cionae]PLS20457.1 DUF393 domain-containing protein [Amylibacter cionae]